MTDGLERLSQADFQDMHDIASVRWNDDRTCLIVMGRDGRERELRIKPDPKKRRTGRPSVARIVLTDPEPKRRRQPVTHVDLTVMDRVDAVISERLR